MPAPFTPLPPTPEQIVEKERERQQRADYYTQKTRGFTQSLEPHYFGPPYYRYNPTTRQVMKITGLGTYKESDFQILEGYNKRRILEMNNLPVYEDLKKSKDNNINYQNPFSSKFSEL